MKMSAKTAAKAKTYHIPITTTPEDLKMKRVLDNGTVLTFDDRILVAGYSYDPNGRCYYGAIYRFTTTNHTCEGPIELVSISEDTFKDDGHAIAWAKSNSRKTGVKKKRFRILKKSERNSAKNSLLSAELRTELQEYVVQMERLDDQEDMVRGLMTREGVFDDAERLGEVTEWLPSCYLRFSFFERLYQLEPRVLPSQTPQE